MSHHNWNICFLCQDADNKEKAKKVNVKDETIEACFREQMNHLIKFRSNHLMPEQMNCNDFAFLLNNRGEMKYLLLLWSED